MNSSTDLLVVCDSEWPKERVLEGFRYSMGGRDYVSIFFDIRLFLSTGLFDEFIAPHVDDNESLSRQLLELGDCVQVVGHGLQGCGLPQR